MNTIQRCPGCSGRLKATEKLGVYTCRACQGLIATSIYLGDSYGLVLPYWETGDTAPEDLRYFDFTCLGSNGLQRRHGWYNRRTRRTVQVG